MFENIPPNFSFMRLTEKVKHTCKLPRRRIVIILANYVANFIHQVSDHVGYGWTTKSFKDMSTKHSKSQCKGFKAVTHIFHNWDETWEFRKRDTPNMGLERRLETETKCRGFIANEDLLQTA